MFNEKEWTEEELVQDFEDRMKIFDKENFVRREVLQKITSDGEYVPAMNDMDLGHVEHCLGVLIDFMRGQDTGSHFISAVVRNDLLDAATRADGANSKALAMYAKFLYNHVPQTLVKLRKEELEEAKRRRYE